VQELLERFKAVDGLDAKVVSYTGDTVSLMSRFADLQANLCVCCRCGDALAKTL